MIATSERAREFAVLRLIGPSRRQVRAMVRAETLIMVAFGLTIGSLVAAPGLAVFSYVPHISMRTYKGPAAVLTCSGSRRSCCRQDSPCA